MEEAVTRYLARTGHTSFAPKAALIDMDGTLINSMKLHTAAWHRMMTELGVECTQDEFYIYEGMTGAETINLLFNRAFGRDATQQEKTELYARKTGYFNELPKPGIVPGADRMVSTLMARGIIRVLVTGSGQKSNLDRLNTDFPGGFADSLRITSHDVEHCKPHPEPYLKAMHLAGMAPWESIAVENAPLGVRSASEAGAFAVAVTTGPIPAAQMWEAGADAVFPSMEAFADTLPMLLEMPVKGDTLTVTSQPESPASRICFITAIPYRLKNVYAMNNPDSTINKSVIAPAASERIAGAGSSELIFTNHVAEALDEMIEKLTPPSVFVIVDTNTASFVLPRLQSESKAVGSATIITTKAGEMFKNIDSLASLWKQLGDNGATSRSVVINLGGGVVTDMGAFAASTFKRGIPFINIPTTLLGAVDASVGGKTGINFNSLKNEVGLFSLPELVIISTTFFRTLTSQELLAGYAEMLKHAFLSSKEMTDRLLRYDVTAYDPDSLLELLRESVAVKQRYVAADVCDKGARHALNFGHTVAHAFESLAMERKSPLTHGYAVAFGMVVALVLSRMKFNFPSEELQRYAAYVSEHYGAFDITCDDYKRLLQFMRHDKKNSAAGVISVTLLRAIGEVEINVTVSDDEITAALDIYRDLLHIQ